MCWRRVGKRLFLRSFSFSQYGNIRLPTLQCTFIYLGMWIFCPHTSLIFIIKKWFHFCFVFLLNANWLRYYLLLLIFVIYDLLTVFSNKSSLRPHIYYIYMYSICRTWHFISIFFLLLVFIRYYNYSHELSQFFGKKVPRKRNIFKHRTWQKLFHLIVGTHSTNY